MFFYIYIFVVPAVPCAVNIIHGNHSVKWYILKYSTVKPPQYIFCKETLLLTCLKRLKSKRLHRLHISVFILKQVVLLYTHTSTYTHPPLWSAESFLLQQFLIFLPLYQSAYKKLLCTSNFST